MTVGTFLVDDQTLQVDDSETPDLSGPDRRFDTPESGHGDGDTWTIEVNTLPFSIIYRVVETPSWFFSSCFKFLIEKERGGVLGWNLSDPSVSPCTVPTLLSCHSFTTTVGDCDRPFKGEVVGLRFEERKTGWSKIFEDIPLPRGVSMVL